MSFSFYLTLFLVYLNNCFFDVLFLFEYLLCLCDDCRILFNLQNSIVELVEADIVSGQVKPSNSCN